jgi:7-cyano-7-deazaguanine synthase
MSLPVSSPEAVRAVVLLSGGLDSATVLAMARAEGRVCHAVSFDYGQRHRAELLAAAKLAASLGAVEHRVMKIDTGGLGGSALTDTAIAVPENVKDANTGAFAAPLAEGIPVTYVPARNTVFLALALGMAEVVGATELWVGVNAVDYSGYPDCRPAFVEAFERLANLATKVGVESAVPHFRVRAPLVESSKADIIRAGTALGLDYGLTVSCYQATSQGQACGRCDSCRLRREGFAAAGVPDPTLYVG